MARRWIRRAFAGVLILLGTLFVFMTVDLTPWIGSPQFDYPSFDLNAPFWSNVALIWLTAGAGGAIVAAVGFLLWSFSAASAPTVGRTLRVGLASFGVALIWPALRLILNLILIQMLSRGGGAWSEFLRGFAMAAVAAAAVCVGWLITQRLIAHVPVRSGRFAVGVAVFCLSVLAFAGPVLVLALTTGLRPGYVWPMSWQVALPVSVLLGVAVPRLAGRAAEQRA